MAFFARMARAKNAFGFITVKFGVFGRKNFLSDFAYNLTVRLIACDILRG